MKKYLFIAASALALASCSSEDFVGTEGGNVENGANKAINFAGETGKTTRAANGNKVGADAADLLGKKFYVLGTKGTLPTNSPTTTKVFDNYQVQWGANTAGTSSDNTNDWKYAGLDFVALNTTIHAKDDKQTIKYWDYSQPQYDFIAYSIGGNTLVTDNTATLKDNEVLGTTIVTPNEKNLATDGTYASYSLKANTIKALKECYYTDVTTVEKKNYGKPVQFTFKNLTARVRVAFYETVPGYSVKGLEFYKDDNTARSENISTNTSATLYTTGTDKLAQNGKILVTYPVVGQKAFDDKTKGYNKAIVSVTPETNEQKSILELGTVNYNTEFLAKTAKEATMAGKPDDKYYTAVLPTADGGKPLTLRMNYTLVSDDGSKEEIKVYGAKAVIPASYTQWQPNFAYTYIFKISDNTNGATSPDAPKDGLFPITFDAVVADIDNVDFNQETITTVSTPSVTTYAFDTTKKEVIMAYGNGNEYPAAAATDIYVSVTATKASDDGSIKVGTPKSDLNDATKSQLYTIDAKHANATEAEVIDALQVQFAKTGTSIEGRNGVTLTQVGENTVSYPETIPSADNKTIKVTKNSVAKFTATTNATTYAYVYKEKDGEESTITTAIEGDNKIIVGENVLYYTDYKCTEPVAKGETLKTGKIYYKQYKNNNNSYAVKVIKTFVTPKP